MEFKLLRPFDEESPEIQQETTDRVKERYEFGGENEWVLYRAKVWYETFGDVTKAVSILDDRLAHDSRDARLFFCLAECYSRIPACAAECLEHCERGLQIDPMSDYGYTIKARVELALERPFDAYRSAMAALQINSGNFEAGVYLGTIGFAIALSENNKEEMKLSIENLRTTLSLNPNSALLARIIAEDEAVLSKVS